MEHTHTATSVFNNQEYMTVIKALEKKGNTCVVRSIDGIPIPMPDDYDPKRANLFVNNGVVTTIIFG